MSCDIDFIMAREALELLEWEQAEETRRAEEKDNNVLRLIDYNNRRIMQGLRPVDYPEGKT